MSVEAVLRLVLRKQESKLESQTVSISFFIQKISSRDFLRYLIQWILFKTNFLKKLFLSLAFNKWNFSLQVQYLVFRDFTVFYFKNYQVLNLLLQNSTQTLHFNSKSIFDLKFTKHSEPNSKRHQASKCHVHNINAFEKLFRDGKRLDEVTNFRCLY